MYYISYKFQIDTYYQKNYSKIRIEFSISISINIINAYTFNIVSNAAL